MLNIAVTDSEAARGWEDIGARWDTYLFTVGIIREQQVKIDNICCHENKKHRYEIQWTHHCACGNFLKNTSDWYDANTGKTQRYFTPDFTLSTAGLLERLTSFN